MNSFLHLLWFEILRLRWMLLWFAGLLLVELAAQAWLVWGPPEVLSAELSSRGVGMWVLLILTLVIFSAALFLEHAPTGPRQPVLTQAVPRLPLASAKLTLFAVVLGLWWGGHAVTVLGIHGAPLFLLWETSLSWYLPAIPVFLVTAWLAAQSETAVGLPRHFALWALGCVAFLMSLGWIGKTLKWELPSTPDPIGDYRISLIVLAPVVIGLQYLYPRRWHRMAASVAGLLLLLPSACYPLHVSSAPGPQFPPVIEEPVGRATVLEQKDFFELRLRLDPGLLAPDEYAFIANVSLVRTDGFRIPPTAANWTSDQLAAIRQASVERTGNLETAAILPFKIPSVAEGQLLAGEAVLRVFRLAPLPVTLAPGESERHYRHHGRNHSLAMGGMGGIFERPAFPGEANELGMNWPHQVRLMVPAAIRVSRSGEPAVWLFPALGQFAEESGADLIQLAFAVRHSAALPDVVQSTREFFEDQPVRVIKVRLVP